MIYTLIVEDEEPAAARLIKLLKKTDAEIEIAAVVDSVESAVKWLNSNRQPDLLMLDIQLGDGMSFDIFRKTKVDSYVIFTTAYDEYAVKAFELNSIDYLLKPIDEKKLSLSLSKYKRFTSLTRTPDIERLIETIENRKEKYKKRFVVSIANRIRVIESDEIAYLFSKEKNTFICTADNRHYPVEFSLDHIEQMLDPGLFFRINRQFIVSYRSIGKIEILSKSRIRIETVPKSDEEMLVSTARTYEFRKWLEK
jgi:DNA-binding LytR/AlgR family response regulator